MIVLYVLGYFNRNKQNSYAALIQTNTSRSPNVGLMLDRRAVKRRVFAEMYVSHYVSHVLRLGYTSDTYTK